MGKLATFAELIGKKAALSADDIAREAERARLGRIVNRADEIDQSVRNANLERPVDLNQHLDDVVGDKTKDLIDLSDLNPTQSSNEEFLKRLQTNTLESPEQMISRQRQAILDRGISPSTPVNLNSETLLSSIPTTPESFSVPTSKIERAKQWVLDNKKKSIAAAGLGAYGVSKALSPTPVSPSLPSSMTMNNGTESPYSREYVNSPGYFSDLDRRRKEMEEAKNQSESTVSSTEVSSIKKDIPEPRYQKIFEAAGNSIGGDAELQEAMESRDRQILINNLGKAASMFGSSMAKVAPSDTGIFDSNIKNAENRVLDYKARIENQKNDPKSAASVAAREAFRRFGGTVADNVSANDIDKLQKLQETHETQKQNQQLINLRMKEAKETSDSRIATKNDKDTNDWITKVSKELMNRGEGTSKMEEAQRIMQSALSNPNSITDIAALYSLIKVLDPASVVREGEVALARSGQGVWGNLGISLSQITNNPRLITPKVLSDIKNQVDYLAKGAASEYGLKRDLYIRQANSRGIPENRYNEIDARYQATPSRLTKEEEEEKNSLLTEQSDLIKKQNDNLKKNNNIVSPEVLRKGLVK